MPRWRRRRGRPRKPRWIERQPLTQYFVPRLRDSQSQSSVEKSASIVLTAAEHEVLRLIDLEGLTQEEAGERMGVSRGTVWRTLQSARRKVTEALVEGRKLTVAPSS